MQTDVLVIGGGPAGLATAIATRLNNLRVTVIDHRAPPIEKACGEGLLPEAVLALGKMGIGLDSTEAIPFAGFRFSDDESSATARIPGRKGYGLRRAALHQMLVDRAAEVGVSLFWGESISHVDLGGVCASGGLSVSCRWLVGADGQHSRVRKLAGLDPRHRWSRYGFRRHFSIKPWTELVEVHWGERLEVIATPTGPCEICVSLFASNPALRTPFALDAFPELAERLHDATAVSREVGAITSLGCARRVVRDNVALVGDASCTVDGVGGQGLSLAFQQAIALGESLAAGNLAPYESAHRRIVQMPMRLTALLLAMNASSLLRRKVLRLFASNPSLFSTLVSVHTGASSPEAIRAREIVNLGWQALWA
jgi:menaquinone-9 beta-reductase